MFAVVVCVSLAISDCCGASVAATSCETRLLTLMIEPPAAPALELLAIETGPLSVVALVVVIVASPYVGEV